MHIFGKSKKVYELNELSRVYCVLDGEFSDFSKKYFNNNLPYTEKYLIIESPINYYEAFYDRKYFVIFSMHEKHCNEIASELENYLVSDKKKIKFTNSDIFYVLKSLLFERH